MTSLTVGEVPIRNEAIHSGIACHMRSRMIIQRKLAPCQLASGFVRPSVEHGMILDQTLSISPARRCYPSGPNEGSRFPGGRDGYSP